MVQVLILRKGRAASSKFQNTLWRTVLLLLKTVVLDQYLASVNDQFIGVTLSKSLITLVIQEKLNLVIIIENYQVSRRGAIFVVCIGKSRLYTM